MGYINKWWGVKWKDGIRFWREGVLVRVEVGWDKVAVGFRYIMFMYECYSEIYYYVLICVDKNSCCLGWGWGIFSLCGSLGLWFKGYWYEDLDIWLLIFFIS